MIPAKPTVKRKMSFRERNPDLDFEDIMRNPNVPDDVKFYLKSSMSLTAEEEFKDEFAELEEGQVKPLPRVYSDAEVSDSDMSENSSKKKKKKKKHDSDYDDDWFESVGQDMFKGADRKKKKAPKRVRPSVPKAEKIKKEVVIIKREGKFGINLNRRKCLTPLSYSR